MTKRAHWPEATFVVTSTIPAWDGTAALNRYGYCRECKADMQAFGGDGKDGPVLHYNSHGYAKRLGLWGSPRRGGKR